MENIEMKTSENLVSNSFTSEEYNLPLTRYEFYVLIESLPMHITKLNDIIKYRDDSCDDNSGEQLCAFTSIYNKLCRINK